MKVVYIAGPFRAKSAWDIEQNIRKAEALSLEVWKLGAAAICPHTNTRFFQNAAPDEVWLKGDLEILRRCDVVLFTDNWKTSEGAKIEEKFAKEHNIPCFFNIVNLKDWLEFFNKICGSNVYKQSEIQKITELPEFLKKPIYQRLILSGNFEQACQYASKNEWQKNEWKYIVNSSHIRGLKDVELHKVGTWKDRKDIFEILTTLEPLKFHGSLLVIEEKEILPEKSVCQEADELCNPGKGDRSNAYGHPLDDYTRTTKAFNAFTGHKLTAEDGIIFMECVKLSRECNSPKRDNRVDGAGYWKCLDLVHQEREKRKNNK